MYVAPAFKTDDSAAWALVAARSFGVLTIVNDGWPVAVHVPFHVSRAADGKARLQIHLARANPMHAMIATGTKAMIVVSGPDAYISPDWYVSKDQVPTWNYVAAHLYGTARVIDAAEALDHVETLSLAFEERLRPKKPWSTMKMPAQKREAMLRAIVPIEVEIERIEASFKLSQNKTIPDRLEVSRMLDWRGGWGESAMAEAMLKSLKDEQAKADAKQSA